MYGQNLGGRPDAPSEPIFTKFCTPFRVPDMFLSFEFQKDRVKNVGAVGVEISPLPLTRHIAYTTACCYRTSRDYYLRRVNEVNGGDNAFVRCVCVCLSVCVFVCAAAGHGS